MRTFATLIAAAIAALAACATVQAATISPAGVRFPALAVNARGETVVAWERTTAKFALEVRTGRSPERLGPVQRLSPSGYQAQVAVGADGTIAVAWLEYRDRGSRVMRVAVARRGHGFGKPQLLDRRTANVAPVGVAVQPNRRVVAVWRRTGNQLAFALAPRNRRFGPARDLTPQANAGTSLVLDPRDGAIVLTYATPPSFGPPPVNPQAAVRTLSPSATAFSAETVLTATGPGTGPLVEARPVAVSGPGGTAVAYSLTGDPRTLNITRRGADGAWAPAERIAIAGFGGRIGTADLRATLPADGSALAAWSVGSKSRDAPGAVEGSRIVASIAGPSAPFGSPEVLARAPRPYGSPPAVAAAGEEAFVASAKQYGPVVLGTRLAGAGKLRRRTLTTRGDGDITLAAGGTHVLAIYQQQDRLRLTVVR